MEEVTGSSPVGSTNNIVLKSLTLTSNVIQALLIS